MFTPDYSWFPVFSCVPMITTVNLCLFAFVYPCLIVFNYVYTCLPMFALVYLCLPMFIRVYMFTMFTRACFRILTLTYGVNY